MTKNKQWLLLTLLNTIPLHDNLLEWTEIETMNTWVFLWNECFKFRWITVWISIIWIRENENESIEKRLIEIKQKN